MLGSITEGHWHDLFNVGSAPFGGGNVAGPQQAFPSWCGKRPAVGCAIDNLIAAVITYAGEHNRQLQTRPESAGPLSTELECWGLPAIEAALLRQTTRVMSLAVCWEA